LWSSQEKIYRSIYVTIFWLNWISCRVQKLSPVVCPCNTSRDSVLNLIENKNLCYFLQYSLFFPSVYWVYHTLSVLVYACGQIYTWISLSLSLFLSNPTVLFLSVLISQQKGCIIFLSYWLRESVMKKFS
jgi:hypothetical protein